ncbi:MAG TPA: hypothetical protein VFT28_15405 [Gemmatimonadales bacterium]|nr:hypothetical protein [Gemmatimonadales bacterium]
MGHSGTAIILGLALVATSCGGKKVEINPESEMVGTRWNATLATPTQLAGAVQVKGTGWMADEKGDTTKTRAFVSIQNAVPGGEHPWHVHVGQCGSDRGIFGAVGAYQPLRVGSNGQAQESAVLQVPVPTTGQYFINVHASRNNMGTIIACGNLAPPSR